MSFEFDRYAQTYDDILEATLGKAYDVDRFAAYKVDEIAYLLKDVAVERVLDFGCGIGRSLSFLARAFPKADLVGFDPSEECVMVARSRHLTASLSTMWEEIRVGQFDCVFVANVFHHIPINQRASEIKRCADVLRVGGSLIIFEHNPYNPATQWVFGRCAFDRDASMIRRREMIALGRGVGLQVMRKAYTLFLPFEGYTWATLQRSLNWIPLGAQYYVQFVK